MITLVIIIFNSSAYISKIKKQYDFKDQCLFAAIPDEIGKRLKSGIAANKH